MSIDLATKAGVLRFAELRRAEMAADFLREGCYECNGCSYSGIVFATHEPIVGRDGARSGPKLRQVTALPVTLPVSAGTLLDWTRRTSFFGHLMREYGKAAKSIGALILTEAWMARDKGPDDYEYGWVQKQPERREALVVQLEHVAVGKTGWLACIQRDPVRLDPWVQSGPMPHERPGRLDDLVEWRS